MHKIIASYVKQFVRENELCDLDEAAQFEYFVNYCLRGMTLSKPSILSVLERQHDDGIDGAAVILEGEVITTAEEAPRFSRARGTAIDRGPIRVLPSKVKWRALT